MSRVFIVRHGNTFDPGDTVLRVGGKTDLPLSFSGVEQAIRLSETFADIGFAQAYSSDLKRTRQTIETILKSQDYRIADFLTEIDYGPDEGQPESKVIERIGQKALTDWDEKALPPPGWQVDIEALRAGWSAFLKSCDPTSDTLVVTSNGVARFLLDVVEGAGTVPLKLRTGAYGIVDIGGETPTLLSWDVRPERL